MGKKLSDEVVSDADESMEDAPEPQTAAESSSQPENSSRETGSSSPDSGSEGSSSDESEPETNTNDKSTSIKRVNPLAEFVPPAGFKTAKSKTRPTSSASSVLSNLEGKQIFHIAAPSFLPLSQIREVALEKALRGEPVLTHKGIDYGIPADAQQKQGTQTLLVYDEKADAYIKKDIKNIQSYTIQELVRIPGPEALHVQSSPQDSQKPARPQPKHLKMRFHPVGSGNIPAETISSSSESEADEPTFRVPPSSKERDHKRKSDSEEQSEKKKKKKEKHAASKDADTLPLSSQPSKFTSSQASSQAAGERGRDDREKEKSSKHRNETSQERRTRKEEKKKRKAEKK